MHKKHDAASPSAKDLYDMVTGPGSLQEALRKEDDLGAFIRAHLHFESAIEEFFDRTLTKANAVSWTRYGFSFKIELLEALGILSAEHLKVLRTVNRLRNRFAHSLDYKITKQDSDLLYRCLPPVGIEAVEKAMQDAPEEFAFAMRWRGILATLYMNLRSHLDKVLLPLGPITEIHRSYQSGFWAFVPPNLEQWVREKIADVNDTDQ